MRDFENADSLIPSRGSLRSGFAELEIAQFIRAGDQQTSQLFAVRVLSSSSTTHRLPPANETLVAKLYDPLYFDHEQDDADPFICVDLAYRREAAAYTQLKCLQGGPIPRYFGSYSLSMPVAYKGITDARQVRRILMEHISGADLTQLRPSQFSQAERQTIMKAIVDAETALYNRDVANQDLYPRNVTIPNSNSAPHVSQTQPIVFVDLDHAWTSRAPFPWCRDHLLPGVPVTPLLRLIRCRPQFTHWVDWNWPSWIEKHY